MNLAHIIDEHDEASIALICNGRPTTYGELRDQVDRFRGGLASVGVGEGDRVGLLLGNTPQFIVSYLATLGLGAVSVPLNPLSPAPEIETELAKVGAKVVVIGKLSADKWAGVDRDVIPSVATVISTESDVSDAAGSIAFDELCECEPVDRVEVDSDSLAVLIFTSGTAGSPRAAMLTHGNMLANIRQNSTADGHLNADDVVYGVLPMFHIFGLNVVVGLGLAVGATILLVERFDPAVAIQSIVDRRVTVIPGAPAMWNSFAHLDGIDSDVFATVRLALSGASRLSVTVAETMLERFGLEIREGYGLTETAPVVSTSTGVKPRFGSVGRVVAGVEVRLVNDNGEALVGDVGEIWVRGDNVFAGYFNDPDATAAVFSEDGWLMTGDMATTDDDGYLYLVDRTKDLIIVSGFNVYPAEVEEMLAMHPLVAEVAVIGVPHPHSGEAVKAFVVPVADTDVDEETLVEHSLDHLARYKCPTKIVFVDELPRNASGKIVRRSLDDALRVGTSSSSSSS